MKSKQQDSAWCPVRRLCFWRVQAVVVVVVCVCVCGGGGDGALCLVALSGVQAPAPAHYNNQKHHHVMGCTKEQTGLWPIETQGALLSHTERTALRPQEFTGGLLQGWRSCTPPPPLPCQFMFSSTRS